MMYRRTVRDMEIVVARATDRTLVSAWDRLGERLGFEQRNFRLEDDAVAAILEDPHAWLEKHLDDIRTLDFMDRHDPVGRRGP